MAKKKASGKKAAPKKVNKSAEILKFVAEHPDMKLSDAAAALTKKGIKVNAQYISVVKSAAKKRKQTAKRPGRPRKSRKSPTADVSLESMIEAKKLAEMTGGIDEAKQALDALAKLVD